MIMNVPLFITSYKNLSVNKIKEFLVWHFGLFRAQPGLLDFVMNILRTVCDLNNMFNFALVFSGGLKVS